eukprot:4213421-Pyramimonas_sp.AAC.2
MPGIFTLAVQWSPCGTGQEADIRFHPVPRWRQCTHRVFGLRPVSARSSRILIFEDIRPIRRRKHRYILTTDQSYTGREGHHSAIVGGPVVGPIGAIRCGCHLASRSGASTRSTASVEASESQSLKESSTEMLFGGPFGATNR